MIVFVVGVYKSGTSLVTSMIEEMGVPSCVEDWRKETSVQGVKHNYNILESYEVNMLNNEIIYSTGQNEMNFQFDKMPVDIHPEFTNRIRIFYQKHEYNCVIKDPRFIGTLKYWISALEGKEYKIIYVNRPNTTDVVESFKKDPWFVNKIKDNYEDIVNNLTENMVSTTFSFEGKSLMLYYNDINKYKERCYVIIYNYLNNEFKNKWPYKIYFAEYYGSNEEVTNSLAAQCPYNIPVWKNIMAVNSQKEANFIIIQDKTNEIIEDESKVIFFGREPKHVPGAFRYWDKTCYKKFHHEINDVYMPQTWWVNIPFDVLKDLDPIKTKNLSVIDSGKNIMVGHQFRLDVINKLKRRYPDKVDIFGGLNNNPLPPRDKQKGLLDYRYYLAIENGITDNYFSEKFVDAVLCLSMPIYYGCKNISKYFPEGSYYQIKGTTPEEIATEVIEISESSYREDNIDALKEARDLILYKYNIWSTIKAAI